MQVVGYVIGAIVIAALGVRYMHNQAATSHASPAYAASSRTGSVGGGSRFGASPTDSASTASGDGTTVRLDVATATDALVHVAGAVRHPGVYKLAAGARVKDAVARAGGGARGSDVNAINLAAKVSDGQQIVVPRRPPAGVAAGAGAVAGPSGAGAPGTPPAAPVNLNTATLEELETLDGVGPATAQKILDWRQQNGGFRSVDDLGEVPGIGPKKLAALRDKVQA